MTVTRPSVYYRMALENILKGKRKHTPKLLIKNSYIMAISECFLHNVALVGSWGRETKSNIGLSRLPLNSIYAH